MEIETIYWREDALNNLKDIITSYHRQNKRIVARIVDEISQDLENIKKHPQIGYRDMSLKEYPQKVLECFITRRNIKVLYYVENDALYLVDFQDA